MNSLFKSFFLLIPIGETHNTIKKARESEFHCSSRVSGSGIAHLSRTSNAEAHAVYNNLNTQTHGH